MIYLTAESSIMIATKPVDFRKAIDSLSSLCDRDLGENPKSGKLFVFVNKERTMIRVLVYEVNGFWLMTKRLSKGKFNWPSSRDEISVIEASILRKLLSVK